MKSLRVTIVLSLVFAAFAVYAESLSVELNGDKIVSESLNGISFNLAEDHLEILGLGELNSKDLANAKQGMLDGKKAAKLQIPLSQNDIVFESVAENTTVKLGSFENLVTLGDEKSLAESSVKMSMKGSKISFSFSRQPESARFFVLRNPDRLVFDFIGIKGSMKAPKSVRSANHPSGFRVVVEGRIPQFFAIDSTKGYTFNGSEDKRFASFSTEKGAEKALAKEEAAAPAKVEITEIAFVGEDPEILKIVADGKLEISRKVNGKDVEVVVANARIAKDKEQVIDATSLNGPVSEIAVFNDGDNVKIAAKLKDAKNSLNIETASNGTELVFNSNVEKNQGVAGYSEAQIVRLPQSAVAQEAGESGSFNVEDAPVQYTGKKINLDFKEVDILDILRLMSDISKLNIIAGDDVKGNVTVRLVDIPWDEALDVILKSKSLSKERFGNIIRVATTRTMQREKEEQLAKENAQKKLEPVKVRLVPVNYAMADQLVPQIKELLTDRGTVSFDQRTNVLIVKDVEEVLDKSEQLVDFLDAQTPQVLIESRIVEATSTSALGLGIEWGTTHTYTDANGHPTNAIFPYNLGVGGSVSVPGPADPTGSLGFTFGSVGMINDLNLTLNVMESEGKIKIVSSPKVATLDNKEAMIQQGTSIPITTRGTSGDITTKYVDATLVLKATPHITADGSILLNIEINKSEPDWSNANYLGEPSIIKKEAKTEILVKSGDTVVIGGVYTNKTSYTKRGVPGISKVPVLGWLFKSEDHRVERSELLIFLTPKIMNRVKTAMPQEPEE